MKLWLLSTNLWKITARNFKHYKEKHRICCRWERGDVPEIKHRESTSNCNLRHYCVTIVLDEVTGQRKVTNSSKNVIQFQYFGAESNKVKFIKLYPSFHFEIFRFPVQTWGYTMNTPIYWYMTPCALKETDFRKNVLEAAGLSRVAIKDQNIRYLLFAI
jgi:hypothetical protein